MHFHTISVGKRTLWVADHNARLIRHRMSVSKAISRSNDFAAATASNHDWRDKFSSKMKDRRSVLESQARGVRDDDIHLEEARSVGGTKRGNAVNTQRQIQRSSIIKMVVNIWIEWIETNHSQVLQYDDIYHFWLRNVRYVMRSKWLDDWWKQRR